MKAQNQFYELTLENIKDYLFSLEFIRQINQYHSLQISDISDGINMVFLVEFTQKQHPDLILKQALPVFRSFRDETLSQNRIKAEALAYQKFENILNGTIPKIFYHCNLMKLLIMEKLNDTIIMGDLFKYRIKHPKLAYQIGGFLAQSFFFTSSLYLQSTQKRELINLFSINSDVCKLTEQYVFTGRVPKHNAVDDKKPDRGFLNELDNTHAELMESILELKHKFMTQSDSLIHGDFKHGSILLSKENVYVIDFEFAFVGPKGYDLGTILYSFIAAIVSYSVHRQDAQYKEWLITAIYDIFNIFEKKLKKLWIYEHESALITKSSIDKQSFLLFREKFIESFLQDAIGFSAVQISAKMIPLLPLLVDDKYFQQREDHYFQVMFQISKIFLKEYKNIRNIDSVIKIIKTLT